MSEPEKKLYMVGDKVARVKDTPEAIKKFRAQYPDAVQTLEPIEIIGAPEADGGPGIADRVLNWFGEQAGKVSETLGDMGKAANAQAYLDYYDNMVERAHGKDAADRYRRDLAEAEERSPWMTGAARMGTAGVQGAAAGALAAAALPAAVPVLGAAAVGGLANMGLAALQARNAADGRPDTAGKEAATAAAVSGTLDSLPYGIGRIARRLGPKALEKMADLYFAAGGAKPKWFEENPLPGRVDLANRGYDLGIGPKYSEPFATPKSYIDDAQEAQRVVGAAKDKLIDSLPENAAMRPEDVTGELMELKGRFMEGGDRGQAYHDELNKAATHYLKDVPRTEYLNGPPPPAPAPRPDPYPPAHAGAPIDRTSPTKPPWEWGHLGVDRWGRPATLPPPLAKAAAPEPDAVRISEWNKELKTAQGETNWDQVDPSPRTALARDEARVINDAIERRMNQIEPDLGSAWRREKWKESAAIDLRRMAARAEGGEILHGGANAGMGMGGLLGGALGGLFGKGYLPAALGAAAGGAVGRKVGSAWQHPGARALRARTWARGLEGAGQLGNPAKPLPAISVRGYDIRPRFSGALGATVAAPDDHERTLNEGRGYLLNEEAIRDLILTAPEKLGPMAEELKAAAADLTNSKLKPTIDKLKKDPKYRQYWDALTQETSGKP